MRPLALTFWIKTLIALAACIALALPISASAYINLGTLDVAPVDPATMTNTGNDWFIEYLKPAQEIQRAIRVSNFSSSPKQLYIYATDLNLNNNKKFFVKSPSEISDDLKPWISIPANTLTLAPGESKIMSVNFSTPKNAGVGLHEGAIIVREYHTDPNAPYRDLALEKGIRVYLNVTGPAITKAKTENIRLKQTFNEIGIQVTAENTGTTDFKTEFGFSLYNIATGESTAVSKELKIKPQIIKETYVETAKPPFGLFELQFTYNGKTSSIGQIFFIPFNSLFGLLILCIAYGLLRKISRKQVCVNVPRLITETTGDFAQFIKSLFTSVEFQKSLTYAGLIAITTLIVISFADTQGKYIQTQVIENDSSCNYKLTVAWGNMRDLPIPRKYRKEWQGRLFFPNSHINISKLIDIERNDKAEITGSKSELEFQATTGPDNDIIELNVEPVNNETPLIRYENKKTNDVFEFFITDAVKGPILHEDGIYATYFKAESCQQSVQKQLSQQILEYNASGEIEATPSATSSFAVIPELQNLFTEELPATPEVLSEFILNSDYVSKTTEENATQKIEADKILLKALEATPDVLSEISATPDLNFVFIPSETVVFPPMSFSFSANQNSSTSLGTMIFVQNKNTEWNTYIKTTNFSSLSGDGTIPASAITITPGEVVKLGEYVVQNIDNSTETEIVPKKCKDNNGNDKKKKDNDNKDCPPAINTGASPLISSGGNHNFVSEIDASNLVFVDPSPGKKVLFVLNPTLKVDIPAGTTPGLYQGALTITSL